MKRLVFCPVVIILYLNILPVFSQKPDQQYRLSESEFKYLDSSARELYKKTLSIPKTFRDSVALIKAFNDLGWAFWGGKRPVAFIYFKQSLGLSTAMHDSNNMAATLSYIGGLFGEEADESRAVEYNLRSLKISDAIGNKNYSFYRHFSLSEYLAPDTALQMKELRICFQLAAEMKDTEALSYCYSGLGKVYLQIKDYKHALESQFKCLQLCNQKGTEFWASETWTKIGDIYLEQKNLIKAREYYLKKYNYWVREGSLPGQSHLLSKLAAVEMTGNHYEESIALSRKALEINQTNISKARRSEIMGALAEAYEALGDFKNAFLFNKGFIQYRDSVFNESKRNHGDLLKIEYETENKNREINLLAQEKEIEKGKTEKEKLVKYIFIAVSLLTLILSFVLLNRYQLKRKSEMQLSELKSLRELEKVRGSISRDLHDDVGSTLSSIRIMSTVAEKNPLQASVMMKNIHENSQRMLESMSDIVWAVNPDQDSLENIAVRMNQFAAQVLEPKNISFEVKLENDVRYMTLNMEKRRDLYLIFKEAVNNIAKYSDCTVADISIMHTVHHLFIKIKDNGKGFLPPVSGEIQVKGNGLKNMKKRAENLKGELLIISENGKGTTIELKIPNV